MVIGAAHAVSFSLAFIPCRTRASVDGPCALRRCVVFVNRCVRVHPSIKIERWLPTASFLCGVELLYFLVLINSSTCRQELVKRRGGGRFVASVFAARCWPRFLFLRFQSGLRKSSVQQRYVHTRCSRYRLLQGLSGWMHRVNIDCVQEEVFVFANNS